MSKREKTINYVRLRLHSLRAVIDVFEAMAAENYARRHDFGTRVTSPAATKRQEQRRPISIADGDPDVFLWLK